MSDQSDLQEREYQQTVQKYSKMLWDLLLSEVRIRYHGKHNQWNHIDADMLIAIDTRLIALETVAKAAQQWKAIDHDIEKTLLPTTRQYTKEDEAKHDLYVALDALDILKGKDHDA